MQVLLQIVDQQRQDQLVYPRGLIGEYAFGANQETAPFL